MKVKHLFDEQQLMDELAKGDQRAFEVIYNTCSPLIFRNILHLVKERDLAEEILQEVFLKLWEKRESIKVNTSLQAYLFRIARNQVMDMFRRAAFDRRLFDRLALISTELYDPLAESTDLDEIQQLIRSAIDRLPPKRREIYLLCKIEGKSYEEVAGLLSISPSTVSDHIVKGTKAIRDQFSDKDYAFIMAAAIITWSI